MHVCEACGEIISRLTAGVKVSALGRSIEEAPSEKTEPAYQEIA